MEVEVYLPRRVAVYEEKSREFVLKRSMREISNLFNKLHEYIDKRDALGLLRVMVGDVEKRSFFLLASEWAKDKKSVLEKLGFLLRFPGLTEGEERYSIYVMLSYSKGFTIAPGKAHHPGDLERVIVFSYPANEGRRLYYYVNTAAHGFPSIFVNKLGEKTSIKEALKNYCFYLKPGDHALILLRKERIVMFKEIWRRLAGLLGRLYLNVFLEFLLRRIRNFSEKMGFTFEQDIHKFYLIEHEELKSGFKVDLESISSMIVSLDKKINDLKEKISRDKAGSRKNVAVLDRLLSILWQRPVSSISSEIDCFLSEHGSVLSSDIIDELRKLQLFLDSTIKRVYDLKRESILEPEKYLEKHGVRALFNLSLVAKASIPAGLEALLNKPLYDLGYPEKAPLKFKIGRMLASFLDVLYRAFQEIVMDLEARVF